jgi:2,4-diaminopentanoate dehydrogenase
VPMDMGGGADDDILELLGAGINVITALAYRGLRWRGDGALERFQKQAEAGGSTLYVAGVNPDFVCERLVLTLSGLSNMVEQIRVKEIFRADTSGPLMFEFGGFGKPLDEATHSDLIVDFGARYFEPSMRIVAERMGRPLDRVTGTCLITPAPNAIELPLATIAAGTLGALTLRWEGFVDDDLFFVVEAFYYCGPDLRPAEAVAEECWIVEIDGRPSIRAAVDSLASLGNGASRYEGDPTAPGYYAIAAPMIQAIPLVVDAPPGIRDNEPPTPHYKTDLRI